MQETVQVNLKLPPQLADRVEQLSAEQGYSLRTTYIRLLADALDLTPNELLDLLSPPKRRRRTPKPETALS